MSLGTPLLSSFEARIEAAIFASPDGVSVQSLANLLPDGAEVKSCLQRIAAFWDERGITITSTGGVWRAVAREELLPREMSQSNRRLSPAAISTLAVIAMHQPIGVAQIERVRGVKLARGILANLKDSGLIEETGRRAGTGKAVLFGVTELFLERFDLGSLSDLPTAEEAFALDLDSSDQ